MPDTYQRRPGTALALSGGGFRATLFHIGGLWRLNQLGYLRALKEITSVSGGSIADTCLGFNWKELSFGAADVARNFDEVVVAQPLREFCGHTIYVGSILSLVRHPSELLASSYSKRLFGDATLQALPADSEGPRFTYATSLQTGASVRFSRPYMAEGYLGLIKEPAISLSSVVAASSPFLRRPVPSRFGSTRMPASECRGPIYLTSASCAR
jgi:NTE family protein